MAALPTVYSIDAADAVATATRADIGPAPPIRTQTPAPAAPAPQAPASEPKDPDAKYFNMLLDCITVGHDSCFSVAMLDQLHLDKYHCDPGLVQECHAGCRARHSPRWAGCS